jgi:hypothetical protein
MLSVNEKIYFWSGIMKDHSDFILTNLSSKEIELIKNAKYFKDEFSEIHTSSKENTTEEFINKVTSLLSSFIDFKIYILQRLLTSNIEFNLPPTFVNHMINEAIAFYTELQGIQKQNAINDIEEIIKEDELAYFYGPLLIRNRHPLLKTLIEKDMASLQEIIKMLAKSKSDEAKIRCALFTKRYHSLRELKEWL